MWLSRFYPKKTRRHLFLLEILVGLSLMALILSALFTSMARGAKLEKQVESARAILLERQRLHTRLQDVFLSLNKGSLFYTYRFPDDQQESLITVFDNGIDPDPHFSGEVLGRIFLDEQRNLSLVIWPLNAKGPSRPWRKEILLAKVEDVHFEFFGKTVESPVQLKWVKHWEKQKKELPSMVRLFLVQKQTPLSFAFFFSLTEPSVQYL